MTVSFRCMRDVGSWGEMTAREDPHRTKRAPAVAKARKVPWAWVGERFTRRAAEDARRSPLVVTLRPGGSLAFGRMGFAGFEPLWVHGVPCEPLMVPLWHGPLPPPPPATGPQRERALVSGRGLLGRWGEMSGNGSDERL